MGRELQITDHSGRQSAVERTGEIARAQFGTLARWQLLAAGISDAQIRSWLRSGRLHRIHPGVYAWGRAELGTEGELAVAVLLGGPGSALASLTALWWLGLLHRRPVPLDVASPRRCTSRASIRLTQRPGIQRSFHRGLPVVPLAEAMLAATRELSRNSLRLVLARAEFERVLDRPGLEFVLRSGRPGSRKLREAVDSHLPALAACVNGLERDFVLLCEAEGIPIPEPNPRVGRYRPDMLWREAKLIVELDGAGAHTTPAQQLADARRQAELEALGYAVVRFGWSDVRLRPGWVAAQVRRRLRG